MYLLMGHAAKFAVELSTCSGIVPNNVWNVMRLLVLEI